MKTGIRRNFITLILASQILLLRPATAATHVVPAGESKWDELKEFSEGLAGVCSSGQWGFINSNGELAVPLQRDWKYAFPFKDGLAQVDVGGANFDFIDKTGRSVVRSGQSGSNGLAWPRMLMTSPFQNLAFSYGLIPVQAKDGRLGYMDRDGQLIAFPQWGQVFDFHEGLASVKIYDPSNRISRAGFINTNGQVRIPLEWGAALSFSEGLAAVSSNYLWGFINKSGEVVIPLQWDSCESFRDGFALVSKAYKFGIIDRSGKTVIEPQFTGFMLGNPIVVFQNGKKGIINQSGYVAGSNWWDSVKYPPSRVMVNDRDSVEYRPQVAADYSVKVERDKKWGLVDINGKIILEPVWEDVGFTEGNFTPVKRDGKWGLIKRTGKLAVQPRWEALNSPAATGKIVTAKENGKWGLFDTAGAVVAKPQWDAVTLFSEGLAAVRVDSKWGLIDDAGKTIALVKWDWAEAPHENLIRVREGQSWHLMRVEDH